MAVMRGVVVRLEGGLPHVEVPQMGGGYTFGPLETATAGLTVGERVLVASVGSLENLVVIGSLSPTVEGYTDADIDAFLAAKVPTSRLVATGLGLTGGGALSADRTLVVNFAASGTSSATQAVRADDSRLSNARTPTGGAGGDLGGSYPTPTVDHQRVRDVRATDDLPKEPGGAGVVARVSWTFKQNSTIGIPTGNGTYSGVMHINSYPDASAGLPTQFAFTDGGHVYRRVAVSQALNAAWGAWVKVHDQTSANVFTNDARLSDARTPTAHTHLIADLPVAASGTSNTTQLVRADDSRLSNARTPTAHSHAIADLPVAASGASSATAIVRADDSRLSDSRVPTGTAGGDLTGTYPNPTIAALAVTDAKVAAANKDGATGTPSMRTLGAGALQAAAGNDARLSDARAIAIFDGGSNKWARDIVSFNGGNALSGSMIIQTTIPFGNHMTRVRIEGYHYEGVTDFDLAVGFYAYSPSSVPTFVRTEAVNKGDVPISQVRLMRNTATNMVAIVVDITGGVWSYPKIKVDAQVGHTGPADAALQGWTVSVGTDLTALTAMNTPPLKTAVFDTAADPIALRPYPVGAIYTSYVATSPATLFGGTWVSISDRVLIGVGANVRWDAAGDVGGSETVLLTAAQSGLPSHNHTQNSHNHTQNVHAHSTPSHSHGGVTSDGYTTFMRVVGAAGTISYNNHATGHSSAGYVDVAGTYDFPGGAHHHFINAEAPTTNNQTATNIAQTATNIANPAAAAAEAHDNMPPFMAVYMWRRTA